MSVIAPDVYFDHCATVSNDETMYQASSARLRNRTPTSRTKRSEGRLSLGMETMRKGFKTLKRRLTNSHVSNEALPVFSSPSAMAAPSKHSAALPAANSEHSFQHNSAAQADASIQNRLSASADELYADDDHTMTTNALATISPRPLSSAAERLAQNQKEVNASLSFFKGVINTGKLEVLAGIIDCIFDSVLKLLVLLGDVRAKCDRLESIQFIAEHNKVYDSLAELLRFSDPIITAQFNAESQPLTLSTADRRKADCVRQNLSSAISGLVQLTTKTLVEREFGVSLINHNKELEKNAVQLSAMEQTYFTDLSAKGDTCSNDRNLLTVHSKAHSSQSELPPAKPVHASQLLTSAVGLAKPREHSACNHLMEQISSPEDSGVGLSVDSSSYSLDDSSLKERQFMHSPTSKRTPLEDQRKQKSGIISLDELMRQLNLICSSSSFEPVLLNDAVPFASCDSALSKTTSYSNRTAEAEEKEEAEVVEEFRNCPTTSEEEIVEETEEVIDGRLVKVKRIHKRRRKMITKRINRTVRCTVPDEKFMIDDDSLEGKRCPKMPPQSPSNDSNVFSSPSVSQNAMQTRSGTAETHSGKATDPHDSHTAVDIRKHTCVSSPNNNNSNSNSDDQGHLNEWFLESKEARIVCESKKTQSAVHQSIINGQVVRESAKDFFAATQLTAGKREQFNVAGELVNWSGDGSYSETGHLRQSTRNDSSNANHSDFPQTAYPENCNRIDAAGAKRSVPPPLPPKRKQIVAYMQVFGELQPAEQCSATYRKSALAAYSQLRDNLNLHEESLRHRSFNFRFSSAAGNTTKQSNMHAATDDEGTPEKDAEIWCENKNSANDSKKLSPLEFATSDHHKLLAMESQAALEYGTLCHFMNLSEALQLPKPETERSAMQRRSHRPPIPPKPTRYNAKKATQTQSGLASTASYDLLDQVDVSQFLAFNKQQSDANAMDTCEIRGGLLNALVVYAAKTASRPSDFIYTEAFLITYRAFVSPAELVQKLIYRHIQFNRSNDLILRRLSRNAFSLVIRIIKDLSPLELQPHLQSLLSQFVFELIQDGELTLAKLLRMMILEKGAEKQSASRIPTSLSPSVLGDTVQTSKPSLLDFKASTIAEQITYLDSYYMQRIELCELLWWSEDQSQSGENTPNLANFTEHFNKVSFWIRTKILIQDDAKERERYLLLFVKVMKELRRIGNFNSCLAFLSALDSGPIRRLDWPRTIFDTISEYSSLCDSCQSFKTYRAALALSTPPVLPYLGLILQDLTFIHVGNAKTLPPELFESQPNDAINFTKHYQQFTILDNMRKFKSWPYSFTKNEKVLQAFNNFDDYLSEEDLWTISENIKPLQRTVR